MGQKGSSGAATPWTQLHLLLRSGPFSPPHLRMSTQHGSSGFLHFQLSWPHRRGLCHLTLVAGSACTSTPARDLGGCVKASPAFLQLGKAWVRGGFICCARVQPKACSPLSRTRVQGRGRACRPHRRFGWRRRQGEPDGTTPWLCRALAGSAPSQPRHIAAGEASPAPAVLPPGTPSSPQPLRLRAHCADGEPRGPLVRAGSMVTARSSAQPLPFPGTQKCRLPALLPYPLPPSVASPKPTRSPPASNASPPKILLQPFFTFLWANGVNPRLRLHTLRTFFTVSYDIKRTQAGVLELGRA